MRVGEAEEICSPQRYFELPIFRPNYSAIYYCDQIWSWVVWCEMASPHRGNCCNCNYALPDARLISCNGRPTHVIVSNSTKISQRFYVLNLDTNIIKVCKVCQCFWMTDIMVYICCLYLQCLQFVDNVDPLSYLCFTNWHWCDCLRPLSAQWQKV